jgi:hypothetical protein
VQIIQSICNQTQVNNLPEKQLRTFSSTLCPSKEISSKQIPAGFDSAQPAFALSEVEG